MHNYVLPEKETLGRNFVYNNTHAGYSSRWLHRPNPHWEAAYKIIHIAVMCLSAQYNIIIYGVSSQGIVVPEQYLILDSHVITDRHENVINGTCSYRIKHIIAWG